MVSTQQGLSWRIVSGGVDVDVTAHVQGSPQLTWQALGGCELARLRIDLPLSALPDLGEQARLVVTDSLARSIWDGYCTDPGGVDDDDGEAFDLIATGSMVLASDRVEPLIYRDADLSAWTRSTGSVKTGQASTYSGEDTEGAAGWLIAHPEGYPIATGAASGIEYRALEHSAQTIGAVTFTVSAGAPDPGYVVRVTTHRDGALVDTLTIALATAPQTVALVAGADISTGLDVVDISLVRTGGATNVTTGLAYLTVTDLAVAGDRVDRFGTPVAPLAPLTSRAVIEDLIGRGLLAQVDPHRAVIEDSAALHTQLAFPEGTRAAAVLSKIRDTDPDMVWMYGSRAPGGTPDAPAGYDFTWTRWPETEIRYDVTEADTINRPGGEDQRCHRISVFYTDTDGGPLKRVVVELANPGGARLRDADPINLGLSTAAAAEVAGQDALEKLSATSQTATATLARLVLDRHTGYLVEPWELRPGGLARVEATGEVLRITEVSCEVGDNGATATLTLGDPAKTLEDKLVAFLRGELDPSTPLITLPPPPVQPPNTEQPLPGTDGQPPAYSPTLIWRGGIGSALMTWTPVPNADPVTYKILIGTSPGLLESPSTLAGRATGDFFLARTLPNGTAFQNGVTYYARAIAVDPDGQAAPGPVIDGQVIAKITQTEISDGAVNTPQLNANAITTDLLLANSAWIGALRATNFYGETITGPIIQTTATAARGIKLDSVANTFSVYSNTGVRTVYFDGQYGTADFIGRIRTGTSGARAELSVTTNPFESNSTWGLLQFWSGYSGWNAGAVWASGSSSQGTLRLASPYSGPDWERAASITLKSDSSGFRTMNLYAQTMEFTANVYSYMSYDGSSIDFRLFNAGGKFALLDNYQNQGYGGLRFNIAGGRNLAHQIQAVTKSNGRQGMEFHGTSVQILTQPPTSGTVESGVRFTNASNNSAIPQIQAMTNADSWPSVSFKTDHIAITSWDASAYAALKASNVSIPSDSRSKSDEVEVTGALDLLRALPVYDYGTPHGQAQTRSEYEQLCGGTHRQLAAVRFRQRGVMAQDLQALLPDAVYEDDIEDELSVDLYALIATAVAAIKDLSAEVADLRTATTV